MAKPNSSITLADELVTVLILGWTHLSVFVIGEQGDYDISRGNHTFTNNIYPLCILFTGIPIAAKSEKGSEVEPDIYGQHQYDRIV